MRERWAVPRLWPGETVAVFATGPSLTEEDVEYCRGRTRVISVNDSVFLAPWADMFYSGDAGWLKHYKAKINGFAGLKVTCCETVQFDDVLWLPRTGYEGFEPSPAGVRTGGNSAYQAAHIAVHAGAKRVLLLGCDMKKTGGKAHYFGDHPAGLNKPSPFASFIKSFEGLAPILKGMNIEVINCTPGSALTCFPIRRLEDVL